MSSPLSARDRARALLTADIVRTARRQLAREGAAGISLRGVARELELTPSALYRYFPSRDELLTQLIVEAYDSLGAAVTSANAACAPQDVGRRWLATCRAVRQWAHERPHEYALVYGSPVPGYEAPERTIGPASQVPLALLRILADAHAHGRLALPATPDPPLPEAWAADADRMIEEFMHGVPPRGVVRAFVAWSQLFGLVSFELYGHLVGSVKDPAVLFDASVAMMGAFVGLPPPDAP
jgi:AcrR family transcriptional regulator